MRGYRTTLLMITLLIAEAIHPGTVQAFGALAIIIVGGVLVLQDTKDLENGKEA